MEQSRGHPRRTPLLLLPNDLHEHPFLAPAVELAVEDLLPWPEVEATGRHGADHLAAHDGALEVGVGVVLRAVVCVLAVGLLRCELLQPALEICMQPGLVVVDEHAGRDVHRVHEAQTLFDRALAQALLDLRGDVDEAAAGRHLEPEFFAVGFHVAYHRQACP